MNDFLNRRTFLIAVASLPLLSANVLSASQKHDDATKQSLQKLEQTFGGRIGVFALDTGSGAAFGFRADERFPLCSTFKVLAAAAILQRSTQNPALMEQRISYKQSQIVANSPITEKHLADGMTVAELCAAALQYSDNTAANLLLRTLGGPGNLTAFARSIGDEKFRLDRWETALNTCIPGDMRDTSTPRAMGRTLRNLVIGDVLPKEQRAHLWGWMIGNTTGDKRIKAGFPATWQIGDKTGSGDYGTANDIAVLQPPGRKPIVVAIYTTQPQKDAKFRNETVASAAQVVASWLQTT